ncbi:MULTISPECIES: TetR/AcrR family transcriptional regulator [Actinoplanes]|uniref:TetR/AcrR family transcriptional regulator n=1 Tax=Actinoplanes TaxID=1865 RepID=UPI0005F2C56E|nr:MULTISPECIES: TetR/AcrR family transcriptional regulator [Actinoplanes]GLY00347.1 hypothetical protein Acsp01_07260 [Actinoplanes sp. NBRC 101535]
MARTDRQPRQRLDPDERRAAILTAAAVEFARQAYPQVKISTIAAQAGASDALVYRYFAGKDDLYAEVVRRALRELLERQDAALAALPAGVPVRDRVRAMVIVHLDHVAEQPASWALPLNHPSVVDGVRAEARRDQVEHLRSLLAPNEQLRHAYALWGWFGLLDAACLHWAGRGCPPDDRWSLIDAALGALEGALGDWAA